MKLRVKCVGYKSAERYFTIGKIYEVENGCIVSDYGYRYDPNMALGQAPSKWFLSKWYTFEIVKEALDLPKISIPKLDTKGLVEGVKKATEATIKLRKELVLKNCKVIFNPPATILIMPDGKKYVSKTHNEDFDPEKGLLMCLAKANGITHLELKKMILNGKHPDNIPADEIKERWGK